jgi:uncharacterized protein YceH (UPF0502 family)
MRVATLHRKALGRGRTPAALQAGSKTRKCRALRVIKRGVISMNETNAAAPAKPTWQPLNRTERRIVGVLVEKAKTTPDQYPLSLNGLVNGSNQKSNRSPQMTLDENQIEDALVRLRQIGAVGEVQGGGRVPKFRHYMKDWLGVEGAELAVMTELLLRGDQTVGELRGRANRMTNNEIKDMHDLRPILDSLLQKQLIVPLTPAGRGQVVTHALYQPQELEHLREKYKGYVASDDAGEEADTPAVRAATRPAAEPHFGNADELAKLARELIDLREEVSRMKKEIEDLWSNLR